MTTISCPQCAQVDMLAGVEVPEVYDGILFWMCVACGHAWPRFTPKDDARLHDAAERIIAVHNQQAQQ